MHYKIFNHYLHSLVFTHVGQTKIHRFLHTISAIQSKSLKNILYITVIHTSCSGLCGWTRTHWSHTVLLTSMCHHPQVRPDDLHVNPLLLVADDHRSPQAARGVPLLLALTWEALCRGHRSVIWASRDKTGQSIPVPSGGILTFDPARSLLLHFTDNFYYPTYFDSSLIDTCLYLVNLKLLYSLYF